MIKKTASEIQIVFFNRYDEIFCLNTFIKINIINSQWFGVNYCYHYKFNDFTEENNVYYNLKFNDLYNLCKINYLIYKSEFWTLFFWCFIFLYHISFLLHILSLEDDITENFKTLLKKI